MRYLISLLFLGIAGFMFFTFADPLYRDMSVLEEERSSLSSALENLRELAQLRDGLLIEYNSIAKNDRERLAKILPTEIAFDQLMLEINHLASLNGLILKNIDMAVGTQSVPGRVRAVEPSAPVGGLQSPSVNFDVSGTYQGFRLFLEGLESHIRITDIEKISFNGAEDAVGFIDVKVNGMSYWKE